MSADAALRVVEGSHATGITYAPIEFSSSTTTIGGSSELEPVPDVDADPERFPVTTWDLKAGDAVAIDSRMLHSTGVREVADRPFRRLSTPIPATSTWASRPQCSGGCSPTDCAPATWWPARSSP